MAKNKLKKAASAGLDALDLLEAQANAAVAAADAVTAAPTTAATGAPPSELAPLDAAAKGKKGKGKLKAAAAAGLAALDEIEPPPSPPAAAAAVAIAPPPPAPGGASALDELLKAKTLLDAGALTQAEFDALKLRLLGAPSPAPAPATAETRPAAPAPPPAPAPLPPPPPARAAAADAAAAERAAAAAAAAAAAEAASRTARAHADTAAAGAAAGVADTSGGFVEARARRAPRISQWADAPDGFAMLGLDGVTLRFQDRLLLDRASWDVKTGERVGLVGPNGCGKSTQLRVLSEELQPDAGGLVKSAAKLEVAMLRQEFLEGLVGSRTLLQELISVFAAENALLQRNAQIEEALANAGDADASALIDELSSVQRQLDASGAYTLEQRALRLLDTMGFSASDSSSLVSSFSGGWKMRIGLCKILLLRPQIVLLDEPTNHLDLESVEWLEAFLRAQTKLGIVLVSHDREFLDRVCTKVVETEDGRTYTYPGGYTDYKRLKAERLREWHAAWEKQQREEVELRAFVAKFRSMEGQAAQVRAKEKALERLLGAADYVPKPPSRAKQVRIQFPPAPRSGKELVHLEGVTQRYGERTIFKDVDLVIERGDRVAIVGPNGAGKSTLLRLILGQEAPTHGSARISEHNAIVGYFEQDQANALDLDKTVLQTMQAATVETNYEGLRSLLGRFMFKGDDVDKKVEMLSGGEKGRLALCRMMLTPCNVLILDEPTNHLDIDSKETLEQALQGYDGTLITVSHDRYFVSQVATVILSIEDGEVIVYDGDYKHFMEQNDKLRALVEGRYVEGERTIRSAPKIELADEDSTKKAKKKGNFGGKGVTSGRKDKGVKNAKRMA
ncbi:hypothetical protein KFE25_010791 [Diacronema lutheri]|uniref:ABC transporter domain-containing protein n=2 Tax=Diacronema lutheri TaxID=2081491 RepID=A0A8J5X4I1_DIALT|nr:hypothetical protein KFE25_010791 [Diacronema lutheri]